MKNTYNIAIDQDSSIFGFTCKVSTFIGFCQPCKIIPSLFLDLNLRDHPIQPNLVLS